MERAPSMDACYKALYHIYHEVADPKIREENITHMNNRESNIPEEIREMFLALCDHIDSISLLDFSHLVESCRKYYIAEK